MRPTLFIQAVGIPGSFPPGELDVDAKKWTLKTSGLIKIESFQHTMELPISRERTSFSSIASAASVIDHGPILLHRYTDSSSTGLVKAFLSRTVVANLQILLGVMATTGTGTSVTNVLQPQWILRVTNALITSFSYSSDEAAGIVEDLALYYDSIAWGYREALDSGALAPAPDVAGIRSNNTVVETFDNDLADSKFTPSTLDKYFDQSEYT